MTLLQCVLLVGALLVLVFVLGLMIGVRNYHRFQCRWEEHHPGREYPGDREAKRQLEEEGLLEK